MRADHVQEEVLGELEQRGDLHEAYVLEVGLVELAEYWIARAAEQLGEDGGEHEQPVERGQEEEEQEDEYEQHEEAVHVAIDGAAVREAVLARHYGREGQHADGAHEHVERVERDRAAVEYERGAQAAHAQLGQKRVAAEWRRAALMSRGWSRLLLLLLL